MNDTMAAFWGGIFGAIVGALVGWVLGRIGTLTEMRFAVLRTTSEAYYRSMLAIRDLRDAEIGLNLPFSADATRDEKVGRWDRALGRAERARALIVETEIASCLVESVFRSETRRRWAAVASRLRTFEPDHADDWRTETHAIFAAFVDSASHECGFRWWLRLRDQLPGRIADILTAKKWREDSRKTED